MTSSGVAATAADETVQKVGGSRKSGINAEWRVDIEVCELERERGIRKTEVKPKDTVKVRGGYVRDGEMVQSIVRWTVWRRKTWQ